MEPPSAGPVPSPEPPDPGLGAAQSFDSPHPPIPPEPPPIASHVSRLRATVGFPRIPNLDQQLMLVDCSSPLEFCGTSLWCVSMNKVLSCSSFASPTWESGWMVIEWEAQGLLVSAFFYRLVLIVSSPLVTFIVLFVGTLIASVRYITAVCRSRSAYYALDSPINDEIILVWVSPGSPSLILPRIEGSIIIVFLVSTSVAFMRPCTAVCRLCSLIFGAMKFFSLSWWQIKLKELVNAIFPTTLVSLGIFCLESSGMEYVFLLMLPFFVSGFIAGCSESKITNTSDLILLKGSVS